MNMPNPIRAGWAHVALTWLAILIFTSSPHSASAQELDLRQSLDRAAQNHPDLWEQRAKIESARANLSKARAGRFPRGQYVGVFGIINAAEVGEVPEGLQEGLSEAEQAEIQEALGPLFSEDGVNNVFNGLNFFTRHELRVDQPIYTFGKIKHGIRAAKYGIEAESAELERQTGNSLLETKRAYYGYKLTDEIIDVIEEVVEAFTNAEDRASEALEEGKGDLTQADVLKLRIAKVQTRRRLLELQRRQQEALLGFRRAIGAALTSSVTPDRKALSPVKTVPLLGIDSLVQSLDALPGYRAAELGMKARTEAVNVARGKLYPDFFMSIIVQGAFAVQRDDVQNPFLNDPFNLIRGGPVFGINYQLDIATRLAELREAKAKAAEQQAKVNRAATGLPVAIRRAHLEVEEKRAALREARIERKAGRALSFLAASSFSIGIGEPKEILESLGTYAQASTNYYRTVHDFNLAVAKLSSAMGRELDAALQPDE